MTVGLDGSSYIRLANQPGWAHDKGLFFFFFGPHLSQQFCLNRIEN